MYIANYNRRTEAVFFLFFLFLIFCGIRLIFIQSFRSQYLYSIAKKQQNQLLELEPRRGVIYDANLKPLAVNISIDSVYACPQDLKEPDKEQIVISLAPILKIDPSFIRERLSRNKSFVWLARKIAPQQSQDIAKLNLKGIGFIKESKRCYPNKYLASHILGFAGLDNIGLEGLEMSFDKYLKGQFGWAQVLRDARQKKLNLYEDILLPRDGYDLVLTIDEVIQYIAERELDKVVTTHHAQAASIIVMDPITGRILAMASRPNFDLNEYNNVKNDVRRNRSICDLFEPGSVFKIVTAAAALEEKKSSEEDKFFCENGAYRVGNHVLHDHRPHGLLTFKEVIEQSSNIGTTKIAQRLGPDLLYRYIKLFGFGSKLEVDLPGEINGMIKEPRFWSKTSIGAIPIGHEVGVTALQLASAISVIANNGQLMRPYVVSEIRDKEGEVITKFSPHMLRRVISVDTAQRVKKILTQVIENGTGKMARMKNFSAAGKTGTAQKLDNSGAYSHDKYIASFIGFAPAEAPAVAIVVIVDEPHPAYFGGVVSAPVFKSVANDVLKYMKINSMLREVAFSNDVEPSD
ncbi:MAG: penicillin-binding transpeptidase domain-containing protein [Candidatus Omnitrophota bacterium]